MSSQFRAIGVTLKPESATSNGLAGMVERLTGKVLAIRLPLHVLIQLNI